MKKYNLPIYDDFHYQVITLNKTNKQLSDYYNVSESVIHTWKRFYKLYKPMSLRIKSYIPKGCFEKGHKAWNKGKKGWFAGDSKNWFNHEQTLAKAEKSFGKPRLQGDSVVCLIRDTHYRKNAHNGKMYKTHKRMYYSRWVLKQAGIEIPKGYVVWHIDGDFTNNDIGNLKIITRAELCKINCKRG